jgi:hypothetical protein
MARFQTNHNRQQASIVTIAVKKSLIDAYLVRSSASNEVLQCKNASRFNNLFPSKQTFSYLLWIAHGAFKQSKAIIIVHCMHQVRHLSCYSRTNQINIQRHI